MCWCQFIREDENADENEGNGVAADVDGDGNVAATDEDGELKPPLASMSAVIMKDRGPFYKHGLTLIPAWINNYTHYEVWD